MPVEKASKNPVINRMTAKTFAFFPEAGRLIVFFMIFAIANVNAKATIGTMTQNETMTSKDLTYKTWYATPTPTTDPTVTSLVESGMPGTICDKERQRR